MRRTTRTKRPYTLRLWNQAGLREGADRSHRRHASTFMNGSDATAVARNYVEDGWTAEIEHRPSGRITRLEPRQDDHAAE